MIKVILIIFSAVIGAAMGSFACCQAWRIRLKEKGKKDPGKRSVCIKCEHRLKWFENIPIISWTVQHGKCRKCGARIGRAEIFAELLGLFSFGAIAWFFASKVSADNLVDFLAEFDVARFVAVLAAMVGMILLFVYDGKWQEMPMGIMLYTIIMGAVFAGITVCRASFVWVACPEGAQCIQAGSMAFSFEVFAKAILPVLGSIGILAGIYYLLYFFSKERLVGGGDWLLCLAIGLLLADWRLALVELCLSNLIGSAVMLSRKKKKAAFGPFLVLGFVIVFVFQGWFLSVMMIGN